MRKLFLLFLVFFTPLLAKDRDLVKLPEGTVHQGDYFSTGGSIEILGTVTGDVYAFGSQVRIVGTVDGDVISSGGTIEILGQVRGSCRLAGGNIQINGNIGRNLTALGGNIELGLSSRVEGNVLVTGGIFDSSGIINGNVTAYVGQIRLGSQTKIAGSLVYSSTEQAVIDTGAEVTGGITHKESKTQKILKREWRKTFVAGTRIVRFLMNFVFSFVIGWVFLKLFPERLHGAVHVLKIKPWRALFTGLLILILLPIACLILFVTILGFPLALGLLAVGLISFYTAKIFPILWVTEKLIPRWRVKTHTLAILAVGIIIYLVLIQVLVLGSVFRFAFTILGLGALFLSRLPRKRKTKK